MAVPSKTTAQELWHHVPGQLVAMGTGPAWIDVLVALYRRDLSGAAFVVPSVAEPMLVMVCSGKVEIEEREFEGPWTRNIVQTGDFFLTTSPTPYEMRWRRLSEEPFETCHVYIALSVFARVLHEAGAAVSDTVLLREVSGERDAKLAAFVELLRAELLAASEPSPLYTSGLAQSLAAYLVRHYPAPGGPEQRSRGGLPAYKLHRVVHLLEQQLDQEFVLARLAREADMSEFHFSRVFKATTGLAPLRYFIRLRMERAARLLRETSNSMMEIALEVGYSSPSHFARIFRLQFGLSPSRYRGHE